MPRAAQRSGHDLMDCRSWPANTAALPTLAVLLLILFVASPMRNCP
jgi:hypothetical protein